MLMCMSITVNKQSNKIWCHINFFYFKSFFFFVPLFWIMLCANVLCMAFSFTSVLLPWHWSCLCLVFWANAKCFINSWFRMECARIMTKWRRDSSKNQIIICLFSWMCVCANVWAWIWLTCDWCTFPAIHSLSTAVSYSHLKSINFTKICLHLSSARFLSHSPSLCHSVCLSIYLNSFGSLCVFTLVFFFFMTLHSSRAKM